MRKILKWMRGVDIRYLIAFDMFIIPLAVWLGILSYNEYKPILSVRSVNVTTLNQTLPTPIVPEGPLYEFCVVKDDTRDSDKLAAGTPIPFEPVNLGSTQTATSVPNQIFATPTMFATPGWQPTETPVSTATVAPTEPSTKFPNIKVVKVGEFKPTNYHFVIVGIGFDEGENAQALRGMIADIRKNFVGVNVDFAYVKLPINLQFKHIDVHVEFAEDADRAALINEIKAVYPVDGIVVSLKTDEPVGTAELMGSISILSATDPSYVYSFTHEMGHQLGMNDRYTSNASYNPSKFPNTELFYLDSMPNNLVQALNKLEYMPPMYLAGTCQGKKLYSFYENWNNIYGDYDPKKPYSWGDSTFTPLQILEMNDYIKLIKGGN